MNRATPPEAKGVGTNSKLYPGINGVKIWQFWFPKFQVHQNGIQVLLGDVFEGSLDFLLG